MNSSPRRQIASFLTVLTCLTVIAAGAGIRLVGSNWDEGANLHPDERHMMFVVMDTQRAFEELQPDELAIASAWFEAGKSPLDPRRNNRLYVYGEFPHIVVSLISLLDVGGWPEILVRARTIGAVLDSYTILAVFLLSIVITRNPPAAIGAAALYAFMPIAIQQSNFFSVDVWLTSASIWSLLAATIAIKAHGRVPQTFWVCLAGGLAGLAVACKLPGLAMVGATCIAVVVRYAHEGEGRRLPALLANLTAAIGSAAITFRLCSPFTFAGPGPFGLVPTEPFLDGYRAMANLVLDPGFPPNWQWISGYGWWDALGDLIVWGIGIPASLAIVAGGFFAWRTRERWPVLLPSLAVAGAFLIYWLQVPTPALRYVAPALPVFCAISAMGLAQAGRNVWVQASAVACVGAAGIWGLGMVTIHTSTNSRVEASRWLWMNTPPGTVLANESAWDDGLPVPVRLPGNRELTWAGHDNHFSFVVLGLEEPDSEAKAKEIASRLGQADYLTISSERMRRPMLALSQRFPVTAAYYAMLASGELCFEPVYRSASAYPVAGIDLDDQSVQEPWSVYDHPTVEIYRRLPCYDREQVEKSLIEALQNA